jgi:single-strand DNA-binding protein
MISPCPQLTKFNVPALARAYTGNANRVILVGNVGNLEIRPLNNERRVAMVSLATSENVPKRGGQRALQCVTVLMAIAGEYEQLTQWHKLAVYAPNLVDFVERNVKTGCALLVDFDC